MNSPELIAAVTATFPVLLHKEEAALRGLLRQALAAYQDRAGVIARVRIKEDDAGEIKAPADYLSVAAASDARGNFVHIDAVGDTEVNGAGETVAIVKLVAEPGLGATYWPVTVAYYVNLLAVDAADAHFPPEALGLVREYLHVLIDIPNTARVRAAKTAAGIASDELPSADTLEQRKSMLEQQMDDRGIAVGMITVQ